MKYLTPKRKRTGSPGGGLHYCLTAGVQIREKVADVIRKMVPLQGLLNEAVWDASKGVFQVKKK